MTLYVECFHDAAYFGGIRDIGVWLAAVGESVATFFLGALIFNRLKPQFGSFL
jgi:lipopolysaccharide transport system permease protein